MSAVPKPSSSKHIVRVKEGGQLRTFAVSKDEFLIGRDERADVRVPNTDVSGKHLYVKIIDGLVVQLRDPGSTNGTFVNGQRLEAGQEVILDSLSDEIRLGKVATINITPSSLQPTPKTPAPARLSMVKAPPTPPPAPKGLKIKHFDLDVAPAKPASLPEAVLSELETAEDPREDTESPEAQDPGDDNDRVVLKPEASRLMLQNEASRANIRPDTSRSEASRIDLLASRHMAGIGSKTGSIALASLEEPKDEAIVPDPSPAYSNLGDLNSDEISQEQAEAFQASAMAQEAAKAAQAAQEAARAAQAAHERAKAAQAAREKIKAEKAKAEAEARDRARAEAMAREKEKAELAAAEARLKAKAAAEAEEAAKAAQAAHEKAKLKSAADDAVQATLTLQKTARLEIEAFKKKAIADIELVQAEAVASAEALKQEGYKDGEDARQKAWKEIEALREEVKHEIEALRSAASIEIKIQQEEATAQADAIRETGQRDCENIKNDGRRDVEYLRAQVKKEVELLNYEGDRLKKESESLRTDIDRLKGENDRVRGEGDDLKILQREETNKLALLKQEIESVLKIAEVQKIQAEASIRELNTKKDGLVQETDQMQEKVLEAAKLRDTLAKERMDLDQQIRTSKQEADKIKAELEARAEELRQEIETLTHDQVANTDRLSELNEAVRTEEDILKTLQDSMRRERELNESDERRRKANVEALDAEYRVKRLSIDAQIGELEHRKTEIERQVGRLERQQSEAETQVARLRLDAQEFAAKLEASTAEQVAQIREDAERKAAKTKSDAEQYASKARTEADQYSSKTRGDAQSEADKIQQDCDDRVAAAKKEVDEYAAKIRNECEERTSKADKTLANFDQDVQKARDKREKYQADADRIAEGLKEQENALALYKKKTEDAKRETVVAQEQLREAQAQVDDVRKHADENIAQVRAAAELEASKVRDQVQEEIAQHRRNSIADTEREIERRKEELKIEFAEKGKIMQRELGDVKMREMRIIQQMQEEEKRAQRMRLEATLEEIIQKTMELARQKSITEAKPELRNVVQTILEGKTAGTLSVEADERSKKFWKKMAIRASVPAGVLLFFLIFPGIPGALKEKFLKTVAHEKNDSGVFLEQIKQRGLKYQPEMDRNYRGSYADNILYLEQYVDMKLSDKEQKEWTLVLNDFIVGRLGLSDRIIPDFMSAEAVMMQDLLKIREGMVPQFKDQGLSRMSDTEKAGADKLIGLLQSPENYQKFRVFEKDYYDSYLKRMKAAK